MQQGLKGEAACRVGDKLGLGQSQGKWEVTEEWVGPGRWWIRVAGFADRCSRWVDSYPTRGWEAKALTSLVIIFQRDGSEVFEKELLRRRRYMGISKGQREHS